MPAHAAAQAAKLKHAGGMLSRLPDSARVFGLQKAVTGCNMFEHVLLNPWPSLWRIGNSGSKSENQGPGCLAA